MAIARILPLCLALAWAPQAVPAEQVKTPGFQLRLEGDWKRLPGGDPEQQSFESKALDVHLTTSYLLLQKGAPPPERVAPQYRDVRLEAEQVMAREAQVKLTLSPATLTAVKGGQRLDYAGHDDQGRRFRFRALVQPTKVVSLYVESFARSEQELAALMEQLTQHLVY